MRAAIAAAVLATALAQSGPEQHSIDAAVNALGGRERILTLRNIEINGEGLATNIGDESEPGGEPATWLVTAFTRRIDFEHARVQTRQQRTAKFLYPLANMQRFDERLDGELPFDVAERGVAVRAPAASIASRRLALLNHPLALVRTALTSDRPPIGFTLSIDRDSNLPTTITSVEDFPSLGDVVIRTTFDDYEDVVGLKMPTHITTDVDGRRELDIRTTKNSVNVEMNLAAPVSVRSAAPPAPAPLILTPAPIARGVWSIDGSDGYRSVVFEFGDHLTLFGVAVSDQHAQAMIAAARRVASKPLAEVIVPSHHPEQAAGVRTAVAEGLTIITYRANIPLFNDLVTRPHTIAPDALARNPRPLRAIAVDDALTLKDKTMEVRLYHIRENPREATNVYAYVPRSRLLVQAGLYDPTWHQYPWSANLLWNLKQRKLAIDRDVPMHGAISRFSAMAMSGRAAGHRTVF